MSEARAAFPNFEDLFLENAARRFEVRRKAIDHKGAKLATEVSMSPNAEYLKIYSTPRSPRPVLILELFESNRMRLYVRSSRNASRGKVLVRIDAARLVDNAVKLVEVFEWTLDAICDFDREEGHDTSAAAVIVQRWMSLAVRSIDE